MDYKPDMADITAKIESIKKAAEALAQLDEQFPAVAKNAARIQASVKMLELNVSDLYRLEQLDGLADL